jgi:hypothetical protein
MSLLNEVSDPVMKLRLELAKVRTVNEVRDEMIAKLVRFQAVMKLTMT